MAENQNLAQTEFRNAEPGRNWVRLQPDLDALHIEADGLLLAACAAAPGERSLDVGCGAGTTTLALAEAVGPTRTVLGIDVSRPMLECAAARIRAAGVALANVVGPTRMPTPSLQARSIWSRRASASCSLRTPPQRSET